MKKNKHRSHFFNYGASWKYKNTSIFVSILVLFAIFSQTSIFDRAIVYIGTLGYLGVFVTGMFFVSTFTVVPASIVLFNLAGLFNIYIVAILAGMGAMIGDFIVFRFIKDKVFEEWRIIFKQFKLPRMSKLIKTPYFAWLLPVLGAIIIASPLPDEVGVGMIGATKMKSWQFFVLTFILNTVGIFIVVFSAQLVG